VVLAQAVADAVGGSSTILGTLLSTALIGAVISAYRFWVNFRKTERGMSRQRITQANRNERAAQHEASLWQSRCGDLEYILRSRTAIPVPPLSEELKALVFSNDQTEPVEWETPDNRNGGSPAP
jgi:hypothetical protein